MRAVVPLVCGLGFAVGATFALAQTPIGQTPLAQALYDQGEGAVARLRGDAMVLPASAARCANCHEPGPRPAQAEAALGPRLDARLSQSVPRRGGPPVAYDLATFCGLLRTGIDPAQILVRRAMPAYDIAESTCAELWQWVSRREPLPADQRPDGRLDGPPDGRTSQGPAPRPEQP